MKTDRFTMRIDPDLKAALQKIADRERRSLAKQIEKVLIDFVEAERTARD